MDLEVALFVLLAIVAMVSAALMIFSKNSVHSALYLILNFGCVALLFLLLDAAFISMVQVAVYAGAIMVLFLFVIMLLGAEQTSDTDEGPGWLPRVAGVLPIIFIMVLGGMLAFFPELGGLHLPEAPGNAPLVRFVHAANVADPVTITVSGADAIENVNFADVTEFTEVDAGEHNVTIMDADGASLFDGSITLQQDDVLTLVAYGDGAVELATVHNSFDTTGDNEARLIFLNLYTDQPITLINIGRDRVLNTNDNGDEYTDPTVFAELPFGEVIVPEKEFSEGSYNWGFYSQHPNGEWYQVAGITVPELGYWAVEGNSEQTIILVPNYAGPNDNEFGYFPRVLDSAQEELVIRTNEPFGAPGDVGRELFVTYLLPVNLVGFLLLVALIGVIVLTRPQGVAAPRRSTINRRRKVSRPLVNVISQQTGRDVVQDAPLLDEPDTGD